MDRDRNSFCQCINDYNSFKARLVSSAESIMMLTLYIMLFFLIIIVPLDCLVGDSSNAVIVIQAGGQIILSLFILVINYLPKLFYFVSGKANEKSMTRTMFSKSAPSILY